MLTTEEEVAVALVTSGCVLGLEAGYRPNGWSPVLACLMELVIVVMVILFAAGVQFKKVRRPWRPRMLLTLLGVVVVPLSLIAGVMLDELDFNYRRRSEYEGWIATITIPPETKDGDTFQVSVPADLDRDGTVWTERQSDGHLLVAFRRSRHTAYVYCAGRECAPDASWRPYRRLREHWFLGSR